VKVSLDNLAEDLKPIVEQFRVDFANGKVELSDPKKKK
jgi:hypothetical protein